MLTLVVIALSHAPHIGKEIRNQLLDRHEPIVQLAAAKVLVIALAALVVVADHPPPRIPKNKLRAAERVLFAIADTSREVGFKRL